jgi:hypothetical protein
MTCPHHSTLANSLHSSSGRVNLQFASWGWEEKRKEVDTRKLASDS